MKNAVTEIRAKLTTQQMDYCMIHMLRDPSLFAYAKERLGRTAFSEASEMRYVLVWGAALDVAERNGGVLPEKGADAAIVMEMTSRIDSNREDVSKETEKDSLALLAWIFEFPADKLNAALYQPLLQDLVADRTVVAELAKLTQTARDVGRPSNLADVLEASASKLREVTNPSSQTPKSLSEEWAEYGARLQVYRGKEMLGLRTGMRELDDRTLGLRGLTMLGAMPNVGKTALTLQLGLNVVRNNPDACFLLVSLEMGRHELYARIHCNVAELDYKTLMFGDKDSRRNGLTEFTPDQQRRLDAANEWIAQNGHRIRVLDRETFGANVSASTILTALAAFKGQSGASRSFIAIDYLQLLPVPADTMRAGDLEADKYRVRVAQDVLVATRTEANPIGDAVMVISEARKPAAGRKNWGAEMADLMGSARLAYAADAVLTYRRMNEEQVEEHFGHVDPARQPLDRHLQDQGIAPVMLELAKGRDGMRLGSWPLEYRFDRSIFRELERPQNRDNGRFPMFPARRRAVEPADAPVVHMDLLAAFDNVN